MLVESLQRLLHVARSCLVLVKCIQKRVDFSVEIVRVFAHGMLLKYCFQVACYEACVTNLLISNVYHLTASSCFVARTIVILKGWVDRLH